MIQRGEGESLITFRVSERIDLGVRGFDAERLADHRAEYLSYEGPVSGGRGVVSRVAMGSFEVEQDGKDVFVCVGSLGGAKRRYSGARIGESWAFKVAANPV